MLMHQEIDVKSPERILIIKAPFINFKGYNKTKLNLF